MKRTIPNQIKATEAESLKHSIQVDGTLDGSGDRAAGQAKPRPSEKYIPIYHVELVREGLIEAYG